MMGETSHAPLPGADVYKRGILLAGKEGKAIRLATHGVCRRSALQETPENTSGELATLTRCWWGYKMVQPL